MTEPNTAASPGADGAQGQAAGAQQGAQQQGQENTQSGQEQPKGDAQGQQGGQSGSAQQQEQPTHKAAAPPERYELRLPEGTLLDTTDADEVAKLAKEQQWSAEQAQATLDEMHTRISTQAATFRTELDADPDVGGAKLEHTQQLATRVLDRFLPASDPSGQRLRSTLNRTGYGNFLPLVKLLARIGQAMGEDQPRLGRAPAAAPQKSQADRLFGDAQGVQGQT